MFQARNLQSIPTITHSYLGRNGSVIDELKTNLFLSKQVHGSAIVTIDSRSDPKLIAETEADAMFTRELGVSLGVRTADCAPLLISDVNGRGVMAVHLGWKGVAMGLAQKSIAFFCNAMEINPTEIVCAIGPCIGFEAFQVKADVVKALRAQVPDEGLVKKVDEIHFLVDLAGWVERILKAEGVQNVEALKMCTFQNPQLFFSYRRDNGETGRQISAITIFKN